MPVTSIIGPFPSIEEPSFTSGGIPFEFQFENYIEQYNFRASNSFIRARCAWVDADDFISDVLGSSTGVLGGPYFLRTLPLAHPDIINLWCTDAKLLSYPSSDLSGSNQPNDEADGWFQSDWTVYGLTFSRLPFFVFADSQVSGFTIPELGRYCIPSNRPRAREYSVNSYSLVVTATPTIFLNTPAFVMTRESDITLTIVEVPSQLCPYPGIDDCLGKVNDAEIELPVASTNGIPTMRIFPEKTLLFRGLAQDITRNTPDPSASSNTSTPPALLLQLPSRWVAETAESRPGQRWFTRPRSIRGLYSDPFSLCHGRFLTAI